MGEIAYTKEEGEQLAEAYKTEKDCHVLAARFDRNYRSIVSKLVQLRIYEKPTKERAEYTVNELIQKIEKRLNIKFHKGDNEKYYNLNRVDNAEILLEGMKRQLENHKCLK